MEQEKLRWGIVGPGGIARAFASGVAHSRRGALVAVGARNPDKPEYADYFPGARICAGYEALLADREVDAVYIATPHPFHAEWAIRAARAGKHVLVEKPIGLNRREAEAMIGAARQSGVFLGEAFMYRLHPMTAKICALIQDGLIGDVRLIKSSFGFAKAEFDPNHRSYAPALAGGGILDVGCYPVSMARLLAGVVAGQSFLDPVRVQGAGHLGRTGVDEWASALLTFPNDILAEVSCSVSLQQENVLRIYGSNGRLEVADFWFATGHEGGTAKINVVANDGTEQIVEVSEPRWLYSFEVDGVADAIAAGRKEFSSPGMGWADTLGNMAVLDKWRADIGLSYAVEAENAKALRL